MFLREDRFCVINFLLESSSFYQRITFMLFQNNELYVIPHLFVKHTRTKNHCLLAITHTSSDAENDSTQRHAKRASSSLHGKAVTR